MQYTSGSTSDPKGVIVTRDNLLCNLSILQHCSKLTEQDSSLSWMPHYHDMGLIDGYIMPLFVGYTGYLMAPATFIQTPLIWLQAMSQYGITHSAAPNFAFDLVARALDQMRDGEGEKLDLDLSKWRTVLNGAEPIRASSLANFESSVARYGYKPETQMPGYGLAESTLLVTDSGYDVLPFIQSFDRQALQQGTAVTSLEQDNTQKLVSCGKAAIGVDIKIVDTETAQICQNNQVGEIWLAGDTITKGYWRDQHKTDTAFNVGAKYLDSSKQTDNKYLRTGDLGFLDQDGELFVTGRLKDVIIVDGNNYYPQDIELTAIEAHASLAVDAGAAVTVQFSDDQAEELVLIQEVKRTERNKLQAEDIFACVASKISEEHGLKLSRLVLVRPGSIDKTSSGKIQRSACRQKLLNKQLNVLLDLDVTVLHAQSDTHKPNTDRASALAGNAGMLRHWLRTQVIEQLGLSLKQAALLKDDRPLQEYGLTSRQAMVLSGLLAAYLQEVNFKEKVLDDTLLYQYSTINALVDYLAASQSSSEAPKMTPREKSLAADEPIAIVSMSCRFPEADSPESFWQLLINNKDALSMVNSQRWNPSELDSDQQFQKGKLTSSIAGFLKDIDQFDAAFFGISSREANAMDPQQRLLMELSWEALEKPGIVREDLAGSDTGVFMAISTHDYDALAGTELDTIDAYQQTGNAFSIAANRISYFFDLRGPSMAIDTACSSSLVAVHQACRSLQAGDCSMALVGGVNLVLTPDVSVGLSQADMLSASGACHTFSDDADGYVRAEGGAVLVLQPLSQALAAGHSVLAVIEGSAIGQDGRSNGLTAPNGLAQQAVIRAALADAGCAAHELSFIETHGTGTPLGDPIEVASINAVMQQSLDAQSTDQATEPCWLGSVKTNIGHLEAAAGMAGIVKSVLALQNKQLPGTIHFKALNPLIKLGQNVAIAEQNVDLSNGQSGTIRAGVSSFGFGGSNAHLILSDATVSEAIVRQTDTLQMVEESSNWTVPVLLPVSAACKPALQQRAQHVLAYLQQEAADVPSLMYQLACKRSHLSERLVVSGHSAEQLKTHLHTMLKGNEAITNSAEHTNLPVDISSGCVFVFSGQGNQWVGMARDLLTNSKLFSDVINQIDEQVMRLAGWSILEQLEKTQVSDDTEFVQPVIFAIQVALAKLLQHWGIVPSAIIGHSMGEVAAAYVSGRIGMSEAVQVIIARGRSMRAMHGKGKMLLVKASIERVEGLLADCQLSLEIAADNSSNSVVVTGETADIDVFMSVLAEHQIMTLEMPMPYAFHSRQMGVCKEVFKEQLAKLVIEQEGSVELIPMFSTTLGEQLDSSKPDVLYWQQNMQQTVQFRQGIQHLTSAGYRHFIEISPHAVLSSAIQLNLRDQSLNGLVLPTLVRVEADQQQTIQQAHGFNNLISTLTACYQAGMNLNWQAISADSLRLMSKKTSDLGLCDLPAYPWQKQRHWYEHLPQKTATIQVPASSAVNVDSQWPAVLAEIERQSSYIPLDLALNQYHERWSKLNNFALQAMLKAFLNLQIDAMLKTGMSVAMLVEQTDIKKDYKPLLERWLDHLCDADFLEKRKPSALDSNNGQASADNADFYRIKASEFSLVQLYSEPTEQLSEAYFKQDNDKFLFDYVANCSDVLVDVLRGDYNPLELLFPEGSLELVGKLYHDWPVVQYFNTIAARGCIRYMQSLTNRQASNQTIRILEVGAGTGGLARTLIPQFAEHFCDEMSSGNVQIEYCFTDVTPLFFDQAKQRFADYEFVSFKVVNLEKPLASQLGSETMAEQDGLFDIVVGANVLHAVSDLKYTLTQLNSVMHQDAMILLYELTNAQPWVDVSIGLIEGWGVFDDGIRTNTPLLATQTWLTLLEQCGFAAGHAYPQASSTAEVLGQHVIIAQKRTQVHFSDTVDNALEHNFENTYQYAWSLVKELPDTSHHQSLATSYSNTLIIKHNDSFSAELQQRLEQQACQVWTAEITNKYKQFTQKEQQLFLPVDDSKAWSKLFDTMLNAGVTSCVYVIDRCCEVDDFKDINQSLLAFASWLQALQGHKANSGLENVIVVTSNAQTCGQQHSNINPAHASLWAMGRVAQHELPNVSLRLIDLDNRVEQFTNIEHLLSEMSLSSAIMGKKSRNQMVYREGQCWQPKLAPIVLDKDIPAVSAQASYLIVGGLGVLGIQAAQRLIEQGARSLLLLSRTATQRESEHQQLLTQWRQAGVYIDIADLDIGSKDSARTSEVLIDLEESLPYPIQGVVHCGGDLRGALIENLDATHIEQMMAAKVTGSWCLHRHFLQIQRDLDFFLMFGSASSVLAPSGQAIYAAANAYQSALAYRRRERGLPATTISWAVWQQTGSDASQVVDWFADKGLPQISAEDGMDIFSRAIVGANPEVMVIPGTLADWQQFIPELANDSIFDGYASVSETLHIDNESSVETVVDINNSQTLDLALSKPFPDEIMNQLCLDVAKLMATDISRIQVDQSLIEQGLDSLMAVTLKSRIEANYAVIVPTSTLMQGVSIVGLQEIIQAQQLDNIGPDNLSTDRETVAL